MAESHAKRSAPSASNEYGRPSAAVAEFLAGLSHPHKSELLAVRDIILSVGAEIQEGIKWNAPSFWCGKWFATFHLRATTGLMLILHHGAKAKTAPAERFVKDPEGLLHWIALDRCTLTIADAQDLKEKSVALRSIIRDWSRKVAQESKNA